MSKDSLKFFDQYQDRFFEEILNHYKNLRKFILNLNCFFDEKQVDTVIGKLSEFQLGPAIRVLQVEDGNLNQRNLVSMTNSCLVANIVSLKMPRNNLGDSGVFFIFNSDKLVHLTKVDVSSNNVTH